MYGSPYIHQASNAINLENDKLRKELNNAIASKRQLETQIAHMKSQDISVAYHCQLQQEYKTLRDFLSEYFDVDQYGAQRNNESSNSHFERNSLTPHSNSLPSISSAIQSTLPFKPRRFSLQSDGRIDSNSIFERSIESYWQQKASSLLKRSHSNIQNVKENSVNVNKCEAIRIKTDEWRNVRTVDISDTDLAFDSKLWNRLLEDWANGNTHKLAYINNWLQHLLSNQSVEMPIFSPKVELQSLTPAMLDGFLQVVIPFVSHSRPDINLQVSVKESVTNSLRISVAPKHKSKHVKVKQSYHRISSSFETLPKIHEAGDVTTHSEKDVNGNNYAKNSDESIPSYNQVHSRQNSISPFRKDSSGSTSNSSDPNEYEVQGKQDTKRLATLQNGMTKGSFSLMNLFCSKKKTTLRHSTC